jgi:template-activating factor I
VPKFWITVLIASALLSDYITFEDQDLIEHLTDLYVQWDEKNGKDFTISFEFEENEFIDNLKLVKKFTYKEEKVEDEESDEVITERKYVSEPVEIKWKKGKNLTTVNAEDNETSFFSWFNFVGTGPGDFRDGETIALTLADEIFPNALKFYVEAGLDDDIELEYDLEEGDEDDEDDEEEEDEEEEEKENGGPKSKKQRVN